MPMYFDDFQVGDTDSFGRYEVTRDEVIDFAGKYDPQPFHLSDEAAAKTLFGRLAASGWHTAGMTMRMIVERWRETEIALLAGAGVDAMRWLKPVYPGDTLRVEAEVMELNPHRTRDDRGFVRFRIVTLNQQDETVMTHDALVLIGRRPAAG